MPAEGKAHAGGGAKAAVVRNRLQRLGARFQQHARRVDPAALDELGWRYLRVARKHAREIAHTHRRHLGQTFHAQVGQYILLISTADSSSILGARYPPDRHIRSHPYDTAPR